MECRLCLCSAPAGSFVSIHDDPHPQRLAQRIWTCCQLRVRKGDHLPDMICLSCVNNLKFLDSFRNTCFRSDKTSRVKFDETLAIKPEEVWLEDLKWDDETGAHFPPNVSSSPDDGEIHGENTTSDDINSEMIRDINTPTDELQLRKALVGISSTRSELDHKINYQDESFYYKLKTRITRHTGETPIKCNEKTPAHL
ncbi:uncharacterized protein LOC143913541 isoform X2 [Arctopsyche grandis]|uniref:uncharacterized protein LOC143913541 isoform X2 n=1 Tax=Arctopsyche grandis TaxID=121162 RepID=UPI00406D7A92